MPRYVDHDARRAEVIAVATDIVAGQGRAALTVRSVSAAAGCSTQIVSHYFSDMAELLHATYTAAAARASRRLDAVIAADPMDLQGVIEALLPMDATRRRDWSVWFAFWSEALHDDLLGADQRARARGSLARISTILHRLAADGRLPASCDIPAAAGRLSALIPGIAGQAMFDPTRWTAARQRTAVAGELALIGATAVTR
jgi:AcrR family transcriptional regulator